MKIRVRERSILMTEKCPLECRYCHLKSKYEEAEGPDFSYEYIYNKVKSYVEEDKKNGYTTQILFTGGEPFIYWDIIKKIILNFPNIRYAFNTSGFLFTEEILRFLSNYSVQFCLSCDGDEYLTNYLRPNKTNKYRVGYMDKFKKIVPILLYYFPDTPFKMIVNPRYVDKVYETYLFAEKLGFLYFSVIIDFNCRDYENSLIPSLRWTDEVQKEFEKQIFKIALAIVEGWSLGYSRTHLKQFDDMLKFLLTFEKFDPANIPCRLFNERQLTTIYSKQESNCLSRIFPNLSDALIKYQEEWDLSKGICPKDKDCGAFNYCANNCCISNSYNENGSFLNLETLECNVNKAVYKSLIPMIDIANSYCSDNIWYKIYLQSAIKGGKINNGTT